MPSKLASIKDSSLRTMIDGNDNFDILKEVRNKTILSVVQHVFDKNDAPPYSARMYAENLIKKLDDKPKLNNSEESISFFSKG